MSDINSDISSGEEQQNEMTFALLLKEHKVLLNKSQLPHIKKEKESAMKSLISEYEKSFNKKITAKQMQKKISNVKGSVKNKFDKNKTGN